MTSFKGLLSGIGKLCQAENSKVTDKMKFIQLFNEMKIKFHEEVIRGVTTSNLILEAEGDSTLTGYLGLYAIFMFDDNGKFIKMGIWE